MLCLAPNLSWCSSSERVEVVGIWKKTIGPSVPVFTIKKKKKEVIDDAKVIHSCISKVDKVEMRVSRKFSAASRPRDFGRYLASSEGRFLTMEKPVKGKNRCNTKRNYKGMNTIK